jgi:hypothetical protein
VDVESGKYDVPGCTEIVEHDVNPTTRRLRVTMIDDLQITDFDSLDILQKYDVLYNALAIEPRQCTRSIPADQDRMRGCPRTRELQLTSPGLTGPKHQSVSGSIRSAIDLL